MSKFVLIYFHAMPAKTKIREMFDSIASDYDKLNHVLSLDVDKSWRHRAINSVLDLACGTGDFAIAIAKAIPEAHVTGVDLSEGMLAVMKEKGEKLSRKKRVHFNDAQGRI